MINLKEEINKYKPVLEVDQVEETIYSEEITDLIDAISKVSGKNISRE